MEAASAACSKGRTAGDLGTGLCCGDAFPGHFRQGGGSDNADDLIFGLLK